MWVALTRAGLRVVCVVNYLASSISYFAFHKVVQQHYSSEVGGFTTFLCEISLGYCICAPKVFEIDTICNEFFKIWKGRRSFRHNVFVIS